MKEDEVQISEKIKNMLIIFSLLLIALLLYWVYGVNHQGSVMDNMIQSEIYDSWVVSESFYDTWVVNIN